MTRTDLLALFSAYTSAENARLDAARERFRTPTPSNDVRSDYMRTARSAAAAYRAMLDAIHGLDIPA